MKSTGIVRKVDELGRIVIPKELREVFDIEISDPLEIFTEGNTVILKKYSPGCVICGDMRNLKTFKGKKLCSACLNDIIK